MPRFAANLSMLYPELDFLDRFEAAAKDGFEGVEYLFPYAWEAREIAARLKANGLQQVLFNTAPGNWGGGERGLGVGRDVLQNGQHGDGVEGAVVGQAIGEEARQQAVGADLGGGGQVGVEAHAVGQAGDGPVEGPARGAADVADAAAGGQVGADHADPPALEHPVDGLHGCVKPSG